MESDTFEDLEDLKEASDYISAAGLGDEGSDTDQSAGNLMLQHDSSIFDTWFAGSEVPLFSSEKLYVEHRLLNTDNNSERNHSLSVSYQADDTDMALLSFDNFLSRSSVCTGNSSYDAYDQPSTAIPEKKHHDSETSFLGQKLQNVAKRQRDQVTSSKLNGDNQPALVYELQDDAYTPAKIARGRCNEKHLKLGDNVNHEEPGCSLYGARQLEFKNQAGHDVHSSGQELFGPAVSEGASCEHHPTTLAVSHKARETTSTGISEAAEGIMQTVMSRGAEVAGHASADSKYSPAKKKLVHVVLSRKPKLRSDCTSETYGTISQSRGHNSLDDHEYGRDFAANRGAHFLSSESVAPEFEYQVSLAEGLHKGRRTRGGRRKGKRKFMSQNIANQIVSSATRNDNGSRRSAGRSRSQKHKARIPLPAPAVAIMRKWFEEHALNPFATKQEKLDMARDTDLTYEQVDNWLSNARRRLIDVLEDAKQRLAVER